MVENDDRLKSVIKKYFNKWKFLSLTMNSEALEMINVEDLTVTSVSGTTFMADIQYRYKGGKDFSGESVRSGLATANIEKTADSYKIISFDRKR